MGKRTQFDADYYERFYLDPATRVTDEAQVQRLGAFVASYLRYLDVPVDEVLDVGCGIGLWRAVLEEEFPGASYLGMEVSEYLCERYGWKRGSITELRARKQYDLVICQGVLQYLTGAEARAAIENLGRVCRGALYLEALTREDWDDGVADQARTDGDTHLRSARWYRRELAPHFVHVGGGVWVSQRADVPLYALERA